MPDVPFVDDSHIPIADGKAIEKTGRLPDTDMWGRVDHERGGEEWAAFTTDPKNHGFAWVVRQHPELGRSVMLYHDRDAGGAHGEWFASPRPVLSRAGGYWWDGQDWYRPRQILDWANEGYVRRTVRQPTTITAEDLLDSQCRPELGETFKVVRFQPRAVDPGQWRHDLALWASRRGDADRPLDRCVVTVNAPELGDRAMLSIDQVAERAGLASSTVRAYLARTEADVPLPQSTTGGRKRWSVPVIDDWIVQRRRDPHDVGTVLTGSDDDTLAPALRESWRRMTRAIQAVLQRPKRHPLRRGVDPDHLASEMGWVAALTADQDRLSGDVLATTVEHAVLWDLSHSVSLHGTPPAEQHNGYGMFPTTGRLLGWFIRTDPVLAPRVFGGIVREAHQQLGVPPQVTGSTLRDALHLDGRLPDDEAARVDEFLKLTLPPT